MQWARAQNSAQIRDASLVAIASSIGGEDPVKGLALLKEVAWQDVGLFYSIGEIRAQGNIHDQTQEHGIAMTHQVGRALLENLARRDPGAARHYLDTQVPEDRRALFLDIFAPLESE